MNNQEKSWPRKVKETISNVAKGVALGVMIAAPKESDAQMDTHTLSGRPEQSHIVYNQASTISNYGNTVSYPVNHNEQHHFAITQDIHSHKYHKGETYTYEGKTFLTLNIAETLALQLANNPEHYHLSKEVNNYILTQEFVGGHNQWAMYAVQWFADSWNVSLLSMDMHGDIVPEHLPHDVVFWNIPAFDQN